MICKLSLSQSAHVIFVHQESHFSTLSVILVQIYSLGQSYSVELQKIIKLGDAGLEPATSCV